MFHGNLEASLPAAQLERVQCQEWSGICFYERHSSEMGKAELVESRGCCKRLHRPLVPPFRRMNAQRGFHQAKISYWFVALLAVSLILCVTRPGRAAFECNDTGWEGGSELLSVARAVAGTARVKLVAELDYGSLTPEDAVLFVHPEVALDDQSLSAFVQKGGRAAVLDDFGKSTSFAERFGINRVQAPTDPLDTLRGNTNLSVGTPVESLAADGTVQRHPLVRDVDRVVLNHPAGLTNPGLTPVLQVRTKSGAAVPIAVTGVVGSTQAGRLLVMSDPSAFINLMIRYPGNLAFARAVVRYLSEDDGRAGRGRLFILTNRFDQTGRFSTTHGPLADAVEGIEHLVSELQDGIPPPLMIALAVLAAFAVGRWIFGNMWRGSPHAIPRSLRQVPLAAQAGWPGRAGVLVSPTTHAALLLVELREAFRMRLAQLVAADASASSNALVATVEARRLLPPELLGSLRNLLAEVDAAERAVVARKPMRVRGANMARLLRQSLDILDHISQLERHHRESSPTSQ